MPPALLLLGASRGLGLALAREFHRRGWRVVGTVRGEARTGLHAFADDVGEGVEIERLDIRDAQAIAALRARLAGRRFEALFVNAGVAGDPAQTIGEVETREFEEVMLTNALGPMRAIEALHDLVTPTGLIGAMSSGLGSVANNTNGGWEVYRASKAALNTLMRSFAARHAASGRALALIAPGWVRTDMGGPQATLGVGESIPKVADVLIGLQGRRGLHYLDRFGQPVPW